MPLHISKDSASGENIALLLDNNNTTAGNEIGMLFRCMTGGANTDFEIFGKANAANDMDLVFQSDGSNERVRFTGDGNVGIGTTSPAAKLHVSGNSFLLGANYGIYGNNDINNYYIKGNSSGSQLVLNWYGGFQFKTDGGTNRVLIDSTGNVGIGTTTNINAPLTVQSNGGGSAINIIGRDNGTADESIIDFYQNDGTTRMAYMLADDGNLEFYTGGSKRLTIDSSGNLGIGNTNPSAFGKFIVEGTGNLLNLNATSGKVYQAFYENGVGRFYLNTLNGSDGLAFTDADGSTERMRIDSSGNVGIGTTSPAARLDVLQETRISYLQGNQYRTRITNTDGNTRILSDGQQCNIIFGTTGNVANGTASEAMRLNWEGKLGIGTTSPGRGLTIDKSNANAALEIIKNNTTNQIVYLGTGSSGGTDDPLLRMFHNGTENIRLYTTGNSWINGGNVGIGVTSPQSKLHIGESATVGSNFTTAVNNSQLFVHNVGANTNSNVIFAGGDTGATGGTGAYSFGQSGLGYTHWIFYHKPISTNQSSVGSISSTSTATAYNTSSDYRLKENVVEMTGALNRVSELKPSRFNFIEDEDKTVDGFLAHEVQDIVPEAITGEKDAVDEDGNAIYQGIDQSKLVPLLVGAIQELKAEIELLKTQINN